MSKLKIRIKNYRFLLWSGLFLLTFLSFSSNYALAVGDAYFPQDTTVNLTVDGVSTNFTIVGESEANEITVNTSSITVNISGGQTFKFKSSGGNKLTNDGGLSHSCSGGETLLTVTVSSTKNVVISPGASGCSSPSGGGGNPGGSAGGNTSAATPTPSPISSQTSPTIATAKPEQYNLKDGDVVSAGGSDDPDVYIVNVHGYKRLFLNPVIFSFYGHLGGFSKIKNIASTTRNVFPTSGLFRNCETNDSKVYGVEVTGEDVGMLHWVNTTGAQAVADDPNFFKKVFCINNNEFAWYKQGAAYTSVNMIPLYSRKSVSLPLSSPVAPPVATSGKVKVVSSVAWLNVRDLNSTSGKVIAKVLPGQEFKFVDYKNGWYKIQKDGKDFGWVFGVYVLKL
ncbi:MAG: SH3 domain-containing protein [bacterium]|nr:SH3 domain-containing protein [bacterium]